MEWIVEAESLSDFVDHGRYTIHTKPLIRCNECKHYQGVHEERRMHTYYHLQNGDTAVPIVDIQNAPTIEPERRTGEWSILQLGQRKAVYKLWDVCERVDEAAGDV